MWTSFDRLNDEDLPPNLIWKFCEQNNGRSRGNLSVRAKWSWPMCRRLWSILSEKSYHLLNFIHSRKYGRKVFDLTVEYKNNRLLGDILPNILNKSYQVWTCFQPLLHHICPHLIIDDVSRSNDERTLFEHLFIMGCFHELLPLRFLLLPAPVTLVKNNCYCISNCCRIIITLKLTFLNISSSWPSRHAVQDYACIKCVAWIGNICYVKFW